MFAFVLSIIKGNRITRLFWSSRYTYNRTPTWKTKTTKCTLTSAYRLESFQIFRQRVFDVEDLQSGLDQLVPLPQQGRLMSVLRDVGPGRWKTGSGG